MGSDLDFASSQRPSRPALIGFQGAMQRAEWKREGLFIAHVGSSLKAHREMKIMYT